MKKVLLVFMTMLLVLSFGSPLFAGGQKETGDDETKMLIFARITADST